MRLSVPVLLAVGAVSFMFGTLVPTTEMQSGAQPQPASQPFMMVEYMKVTPGNDGSYLQIEQEWKPVHQERVRAGKIAWWALYAVRFPGGTNREYDYMTVSAYNRFADFESSFPPGVFEKALPGKDVNDLFTRTAKARSLVREELIQLVDQVGQSR